MANVTFDDALFTEIGEGYKADNPDFVGGNDAAAKQWLRETIKARLKATRINAADKTAFETASAAADTAVQARESAWSDLDVAKAAAESTLETELTTGIS